MGGLFCSVCFVLFLTVTQENWSSYFTSIVFSVPIKEGFATSEKLWNLFAYIFLSVMVLTESKFVRIKYLWIKLSFAQMAFQLCWWSVPNNRGFPHCFEVRLLLYFKFIYVFVFIINTSISPPMLSGIVIGSPPCLVIMFLQLGWVNLLLLHCWFFSSEVGLSCKFLFFNLYFYFVCIDVFLLVCQFMMCIQCLQKPEESDRSPGTKVSDSWEPPCGCSGRAVGAPNRWGISEY